MPVMKPPGKFGMTLPPRTVCGLPVSSPGGLLPVLAALLVCACGESSAPPPAIVDVNDLAVEWNRTDKTWQVDELLMLDSGKNLYQRTCAGCHLSTGAGQLTIGAPALKGSAVVTGPQDELIRVVVNGRNTMPAFGAAKSKIELAAILSYVRNAWGNAAGDLISVPDMDALAPSP